MSNKRSVSREQVREYCERFPRHGDRTIASKLLADHPLLFKDLESARSAVRHVRGHQGKASRKSIINKNYTKPVTKDTNPYKLPESHAKAKKPFVLPKSHNNVLVISDLHIPYHDIDAINAALAYGVENNVNTIFINGDLMDFHMISRFQKDPRKRSIREEFDAAKQFFQSLRATFPNAAIYWLEGNHDKRWEHWLMAKAPEIFDDEYFSMKERLRLHEEKIVLIDDNQLVKMGKLTVSHGHKIIKGVFAPVNAARGVFLRAKASMLVGHTHSVSEHTEKNIHQEMVSCFSTGCLCELQPDYDPFVNKHSHGFAHVTIEQNGNYSVRNYRIIDGKIV